MAHHTFSEPGRDDCALDILAMGEAMVEYNQQDRGRQYLQGFGGDTSNVLIAAARQGARTGYISALGADRHSVLLRALWQREGVDSSAVVEDTEHPTGVYFVTHDAQGHHFSFLRKGSAASHYRADLLQPTHIRAARVLHVSGISLAISPGAAAACHQAAGIAKDAGRLVSFDTNHRPGLWSADQARPAMLQMMQRADICLPGVDDVSAVLGLSDHRQIIDFCLAQGARLVALKLGAAGAYVADADTTHFIPPVACTPVDATGAGDTFGGAFLARLLAGDTPLDAGLYAATAAAMSTEGIGAVDPMPHASAVRLRLQSC